MGREGSGPFICEEACDLGLSQSKHCISSVSNWLNDVHATHSEPMKLIDS